MRLEERCKKIQRLIQEQKNGKNNATQRSNAPSMMVTELTLQRAEEEAKEMEQ